MAETGKKPKCLDIPSQHKATATNCQLLEDTEYGLFRWAKGGGIKRKWTDSRSTNSSTLLTTRSYCRIRIPHLQCWDLVSGAAELPVRSPGNEPKHEVSQIMKLRSCQKILEAHDRQVTTVFTVQPSFHSTICTERVSWRLPSSANDEVRCDCMFAYDGNASWYCWVPMVEWCWTVKTRHLTGLHDTLKLTRTSHTHTYITHADSATI